MNEHQILEIFTPIWWKATLLCLLAIFITLLIGKQLTKKGQKIMRLGLGVLFLSSAIAIHPYLIYLGKWSTQTSLPLHLCTLSGLLSGLVMLKPNQIGYEFLLYWGIPGGFHSILTPEFLHGTEGLLLFEYYFLHGNLLLSSLYLSCILKMKPRKNSWLTIFLWTQLCLPVIGGINWILNSNYMYISEKPLAENPFIIGEWPWYIVILELVMLAHFYFVYLLFKPNWSIPKLFSNSNRTL